MNRIRSGVIKAYDRPVVNRPKPLVLKKNKYPKPLRSQKVPKPLPKVSIPLNSRVTLALSVSGLSGKLVEHWLARPCSCPERKEKLWRLKEWAEIAITADRVTASDELQNILGNLSEW